MIFLTAEGKGEDARAAADQFLAERGEQANARVERSTAIKVGGTNAWRIAGSGSLPSGRMRVGLTFIPFRGTIFRITAMAPIGVAGKYLGRARVTSASFRPLSPEQLESFQATRLAVVAALHSESVQDIVARFSSPWTPGQVAVLNGVFSTTEFREGQLVKVPVTVAYEVRGEEPRESLGSAAGSARQ